MPKDEVTLKLKAEVSLSLPPDLVKEIRYLGENIRTSMNFHGSELTVGELGEAFVKLCDLIVGEEEGGQS